MMKISLSSEFGKILSSRPEGEKIRTLIVESREKVVLDFSGVKTISHSFADELFGELAESQGVSMIRERVQLLNISDEDRLLIKGAIAERLRKKSN